MEPVTHLLTGACLSRAGLNRKTALATATLVISAEFPDIDIAGYFGGSVFAFAHHRGFTHTLLGVPFDAAVTLGIIYLYWKIKQLRRKNSVAASEPGKIIQPWERPRWGLLFWFACIGGLSHILLDFTNNYGIRLFAPFYSRWYSWDIVFIIEPLMLGALILGLIVPLLFRLVNEEIGGRAQRKQPRGRGGAIFALTFIVALWAVRDFEHRRATAAMNSLLYHAAEPLRVSAYPYWINPFTWQGVVETKNFFALVPVNSLTGEVDPQGTERIRYKPEETPVTQTAKKSYLGGVYLDWAQYPILETETHENSADAYTVRFSDLRFAYPNTSRHALQGVVDLNRQLRVVDEYFGNGEKETGN